MACMIAAAVIFVLKNGNITVDMLLSYTPENKWLAALIFLGLYALKSQTVIILYGVIAAAAGIVFDLPTALLVNLLGSVVCISVPYFLGRASDGVLLEGAFQKSRRLREAYQNNRDNTFLVSLLLRAMYLSNDLLGVFFGSLKVPYAEYLLSSLIGILPAMVLYTVLGSDLDPLSGPVLLAAGVNLLCFVSALLALRVRKKRKEKITEEKGETDEGKNGREAGE